MITGNEPINFFEYVVSNQFGTDERAINTGLTIRQHFAAMAMQALIPTWIEGSRNHKEMIASQSLEIADALINELNKQS